MAEESKLLGTLELNVGTVLQTISQVNSQLATLGHNVSLDLTNAVNTAVQNLNQAIANLNNAHPNTGSTNNGSQNSNPSSGSSNSTGSQAGYNSELKQTVGLMTDIYTAERRLATTHSDAQAEHLAGTIAG